jgi:hypothetical protein
MTINVGMQVLRILIRTVCFIFCKISKVPGRINVLEYFRAISFGSEFGSSCATLQAKARSLAFNIERIHLRFAVDEMAGQEVCNVRERERQ